MEKSFCKGVTWLGQPCATAVLLMLPAQPSTSGSVVTPKLWAASMVLVGLSCMALQRSPVAALHCAGSHGQAAFVPLCHPDYKRGQEHWLKQREKLGNFVDMGL